MNQYIRTNVINADRVVKLLKENSVAKAMLIERVGVYEKSKIEKVVKVDYTAPVYAVRELKYPSTAPSYVVRLNLRVFLSDNTEASYANAMTFFNKPILVEIPANTTKDNAIKIIKKALQYNDAPLLEVESTTDGIKFTAKNYYQRFKDGYVKFEKFTLDTNRTVEGTWADADTNFAEVTASKV